MSQSGLQFSDSALQEGIGPWGSKVLWVTLHEGRNLSGDSPYVFGWLGPKDEFQKPGRRERRSRLVYKTTKAERGADGQPRWQSECWKFTAANLTAKTDWLHVQVWSKDGLSRSYLGDIHIDLLHEREQMKAGRAADEYLRSQWRPLVAAGKRSNHKTQGELLVSLWPYGADRSLDDAAREGNLARVEHLLERGYPTQFQGDPSRVHVSSWSALETAVQNGHADVAQLLMKRGAALSFTGLWGATTVLHEAAAHGNAAIVSYVVAQKLIDVNAKDWENMTPLHRAAASYVREDVQLPILRMLVDAGADVKAKGGADGAIEPVDLSAGEHTFQFFKQLADQQQA